MTCLGCELITVQPVTLRTGIIVCSSCPDWRLECEARVVLKIESREARADYLDDVSRQRGKAAGDLLRDEVRQQWALRVKA